MCKSTTSASPSSEEVSSSSSSEPEEPTISIENRKLLQQIRVRAQTFFRHEFSAQDLLRMDKPWVLVENGSFLGGFDWVPSAFRQGPWNIWACLHLALTVYLVGLAWVYSVWVQPGLQPTAAAAEEESTHHFFPAYSNPWWFNVAGLAWTTLVSLNILSQGAGLASWTTFTVQSWTLIQVRFGLAVLAPFSPSLLVPLGESLRLAMLAQSTLTFLAWNLLLGPLMFLLMDTPSKRAKFVQIFTNFRLTQLHLFNIVLAATQGIWGTPKRSLQEWDLCVACALVLAYAVFYLTVLDRLGIHLYLVYSPRTILAIGAWSWTYVALWLSHKGWGHLIVQHGSVEGSVSIST